MNGSSSREPSPKKPVCVLTGGTSGIGLETAKRFAQEGYHVVTGGRDGTRLATAKSVIEKTRAKSTETIVIELDLSRPREATKLVERALESFGQIDVLVHCAAVAPLKPLEALSAIEFDAAIDVNIRSQFYLTQAAWLAMLRQRTGGTIVNVSSISAVDPFPGFSVYGACKAWSDLFCVALAQEGKPQGIRVFSIRPGAVETPMLRGLFPDFPAEQALAPHDVANLIWTICQPPFQDCSGFPLTIRR